MLKLEIDKMEIGLARKGIKCKDFTKKMGCHKADFIKRAKAGAKFNDTTLYKLSQLLDLDVMEFCKYVED